MHGTHARSLLVWYNKSGAELHLALDIFINWTKCSRSQIEWNLLSHENLSRRKCPLGPPAGKEAVPPLDRVSENTILSGQSRATLGIKIASWLAQNDRWKREKTAAAKKLHSFDKTRRSCLDLDASSLLREISFYWMVCSQSLENLVVLHWHLCSIRVSIAAWEVS